MKNLLEMMITRLLDWLRGAEIPIRWTAMEARYILLIDCFVPVLENYNAWETLEAKGLEPAVGRNTNNHKELIVTFNKRDGSRGHVISTDLWDACKKALQQSKE